MVKILLVSDISAEEASGGAERVLIHHIHALKNAGYSLTILTRQPDPLSPTRVELEGGLVEHRLAYSGDRGLAGMVELFKGAREWWKHNNQFDLVISHQPFVMWALLYAGCKIPRLQVCHSFAFEEYAARHGLGMNLKSRLVAAGMRRMERKIYRSADRILVLSDFTRRRLGECFQISHERIDVVPGGVDLPTLMSASQREKARVQLGWKAPVVVTLRRLVPRTGVDMLVQAAAILHQDMPDVRWCIMGDGPLLKPLKWLSGQLQATEYIEFTGFIPEEDVNKRLQAADAFVLPTRSLEGFGLVTVEANACGLPVIATPVGANPEVVASSPDNALAENISPEALAAAVQKQLQGVSDARGRAVRLHEHVSRHYSWKKHESRFEQIVTGCL
ncbi:MAG: hypothetical protein AUJ58_07815 [Zetaproteobacteria bacterium CG1_02_55_237]|nr:MAG: hypothetical protein AUJ58_07815 [Zetaproteobacteria bacterium CG1_02_55_237]